MEKAIQDKAWACLPKDVRDKIKAMRKTWSGHIIVNNLNYIFGRHNLTSDTEPEEMLFYKRKGVMAEYSRAYILKSDEDEKWAFAGQEIEEVLYRLFGDKCLPDEELNEDNFAKSDKDKQAKPKFKVGDRVRVKEYTINTTNSDSLTFLSGEVFTIKYVGADGYGKFVYTVMEMASPIHESYLELYTEEKNDMEEKELNLVELLKDSIGEKFFSSVHGEVTFYERSFSQEDKYHLFFEKQNGESFYTLWNGIFGRGIYPIIFPSRDLYKKYPLDAYSAWMEWKEARKLNIEQEVYDYAKMCSVDVEDYSAIEQAVIYGMELAYKKPVTEVGEYLQKFHEKNSEK